MCHLSRCWSPPEWPALLVPAWQDLQPAHWLDGGGGRLSRGVSRRGHWGRIHPHPPPPPTTRYREQWGRLPTARPHVLLRGLGPSGARPRPRLPALGGRLRGLAGELQGEHLQQGPRQPEPGGEALLEVHLGRARPVRPARHVEPRDGGDGSGGVFLYRS